MLLVLGIGLMVYGVFDNCIYGVLGGTILVFTHWLTGA